MLAHVPRKTVLISINRCIIRVSLRSHWSQSEQRLTACENFIPIKIEVKLLYLSTGATTEHFRLQRSEKCQAPKKNTDQFAELKSGDQHFMAMNTSQKTRCS